MKKVDLSGQTKSELLKLLGRVDAELAKRDRNKLRDARAAVTAIAKKHDFTLAELLAGPSVKKARRKRQPVAPKYRDPSGSDLTWSGMGRPPARYKKHIEGGKSADELLIA